MFSGVVIEPSKAKQTRTFSTVILHPYILCLLSTVSVFVICMHLGVVKGSGLGSVAWVCSACWCVILWVATMITTEHGRCGQACWSVSYVVDFCYCWICHMGFLVCGMQWNEQCWAPCCIRLVSVNSKCMFFNGGKMAQELWWCVCIVV